MSEMTVTVRTFEMDTEKAAALKPLEEAAEVFGAWQDVDKQMAFYRNLFQGFSKIDTDSSFRLKCRLADELADCITACCNLAARYDLDMDRAMERCEKRNRERGRYE